MNDQPQHPQIDSLLQRTVGAPRLSEDRRRRHRDRLMSVAYQGEKPGRRGVLELAFIAAAVAVVLIVAALFAFDREAEAPGSDTSSGVPVEDLREAAQPLQAGDAHHLHMRVQADIRRDQGLQLEWEIERWARITEDGTRQEYTEARDPDGRTIASFVRNGDAWSWTQRGWTESESQEVGVANLPEPIRATETAPMLAARYLDDPPPDAEIERVTDERGEVTRYPSADVSGLEWMPTQFGFEVVESAYELVQDPDTGYLLETRTFVVTAGGEEVTLGRFEYLAAETMPAGDLDEALFEVPEVDPSERRYSPPSDADLPLGLSVVDHRREFLGGTEIVTLVGPDHELELRVSPSTGGFDPRAFEATRSPDIEIHTAETGVGPVTWMEDPDTGTPNVAFWDDGRYRYQLSVRRASVDAGWNEDALIEIVEALSSE